jgi:hypothetical protein
MPDWMRRLDAAAEQWEPYSELVLILVFILYATALVAVMVSAQ